MSLSSNIVNGAHGRYRVRTEAIITDHREFAVHVHLKTTPVGYSDRVQVPQAFRTQRLTFYPEKLPGMGLSLSTKKYRHDKWPNVFLVSHGYSTPGGENSTQPQYSVEVVDSPIMRPCTCGHTWKGEDWCGFCGKRQVLVDFLDDDEYPHQWSEADQWQDDPIVWAS